MSNKIKDTATFNPTDLNTISSHHIDSFPCPRCQTLTAWQGNAHKPFCSERCKLIDLGAWANEDYKLPANDSPFSGELE